MRVCVCALEYCQFHPYCLNLTKERLLQMWEVRRDRDGFPDQGSSFCGLTVDSKNTLGESSRRISTLETSGIPPSIGVAEISFIQKLLSSIAISCKSTCVCSSTLVSATNLYFGLSDVCERQARHGFVWRQSWSQEVKRKGRRDGEFRHAGRRAVIIRSETARAMFEAQINLVRTPS